MPLDAALPLFGRAMLLMPIFIAFAAFALILRHGDKDGVDIDADAARFSFRLILMLRRCRDAFRRR